VSALLAAWAAVIDVVNKAKPQATDLINVKRGGKSLKNRSFHQSSPN